MRVLLVSTAREVGGAEIYIERLIRGLRTECEYTVVISNVPALDSFAARLQRDSRVIRLPVDRLSHIGGVVAELRNLAARHDAVHINSSHPASRLGILMGFGLTAGRWPVISVEHRVTPISDIEVPTVLAPFLPTLFRWSRRRMRRVIAVSKENARRLETYYGLHPRQIAVVNNGVDVDFADAPNVAQVPLRAELGLDTNAKIVLVLARLTPNKGHRYLIEAAPAILAENRDVHFVFAGHEDVRQPLDAAVADLQLQSNFHFLGTRQDVPALLRQCDVFVLPSLAEGFALSLIEAMACGAAVVATRVGGAQEVIQDGVNGYLASPANAQDLARAVECILKLDENARAAFTQAGRLTALKFDVATMAQRMLDVYRQALQTNQSSRSHLQ